MIKVYNLQENEINIWGKVKSIDTDRFCYKT